MIVIKLQGGLGNQMFQYAFGYCLSQSLKSELYFDGSFFDGDHKLTERQYQLNLFNLNAKFPSGKQVGRFLTPTPLQKLFSRLKLKKVYTYHENSLSFNKSFGEIKQPAHLTGFWPSENYFKQYEMQIRQQFTFKAPLNEQSKKLAADISTQNNTVSIHVRRSDYINSKTTNDIHGVCSLDYYKTAIEHISSKITNPDFYIFSDDIAWAKNTLLKLLPQAKLISHNTGADSWQDLALMSLCKHQIIANSTFSWWAAWLNPNNQKTVIAPKKWFNTNNNYFDSADIIPNGWIKIGDE